ncbi:hypothetical protein LCGC14_1468390 [marine sediment metagenome]|uniref:Uncharacterized protein n=1 Tax=marine sediment metagenome TaxID=412755 RepID=A0A0F9JZ05_9ZZZZ
MIRPFKTSVSITNTNVVLGLFTRVKEGRFQEDARSYVLAICDWCGQREAIDDPLPDITIDDLIALNMRQSAFVDGLNWVCPPLTNGDFCSRKCWQRFAGVGTEARKEPMNNKQDASQGDDIRHQLYNANEDLCRKSVTIEEQGDELLDWKIAYAELSRDHEKLRGQISHFRNMAERSEAELSEHLRVRDQTHERLMERLDNAAAEIRRLEEKVDQVAGDGTTMDNMVAGKNGADGEQGGTSTDE